jgi:hypothetical protein
VPFHIRYATSYDPVVSLTALSDSGVMLLTACQATVTQQRAEGHLEMHFSMMLKQLDTQDGEWF